MHHVGSLYILTYDARKLKHKKTDCNIYIGVYFYDEVSSALPPFPVRRCLRDSGANRQKVNENKDQLGKYAKLAP